MYIKPFEKKHYFVLVSFIELTLKIIEKNQLKYLVY